MYSSSLREIGCQRNQVPTFTRRFRSWRESGTDYSAVEQQHRQLLEKIKESRILPEKILYHSSLLASFGFFTMSLEFHMLARDEIRRVSIERGSIRDWIRRTQVEIVSGNLDAAKYSVYQLRKITERLAYTKRIWSEISPLVSYVEFWADFQGATSRPNDWDSTNVLIGPGRIDRELLSRFHGRGKAFHLGGPGAFDFHSLNSECGLVSAGLYTNDEDLSLILESPGSEKILEKYGIIGVKRSSREQLPNLRLTNNLAWLMLSGHSNKAPVAIVDLIQHSRHRVFISGINFFAELNNYRQDAIREFSGSSRIDMVGSFGGTFDRCGAFASHNLFENRALVRNLWNSRAVYGDGPFSVAMDLSDLEYAQRLDQLYGRTRL